MQPSSTQANGSLERNEFLTPLVNQWIQRIETARMAKKPWQDIADQCKAFFSKDCGFMWEPTFKANFIGSSLNNPKFEITIAKAFELVAVFGPYLFWKYPNRYIKTNEPIELRPEFFGPPQDPMVQQQFQMAMQQMQMEQSAQQMRNKVMEKYLNYSQREQPDGLDRHAELAITDALVKGRGLLWVEGYSFPGSGRKLTGCFHGSPDDLFIDPDCKDPTLRAAKWIARRHVSDREELERKFGYPPGTLFRRGHFESMESRSVNMPNSSRTERSQGELDDRVVWYEVWSKQGIGSRKQYGTDGAFTRLNDQLHDQFDQVVGDYAYLCVCDNVPFPLNAPSYMVENSTNEQVQEMFRWRASNYGPEFPTYLDERWPVAVLDFYRNPDSCWPIAPLAPGLGELICLNVLMSAFVEQGYENRKSIIAVLDSAAKDVEAQIRGTENPAIVRINETAHNNITSMIQYLNRPNMNTDIVNVINYVSMMFDKRTGLSEIMYAMNVGGVQSRSARDIAAKEEKAAIRPEKMSADVARWMTDAAQLEKFLAGWTVSGRDLVPLLGQHGSMLWDNLIANTNPEVYVREMTATVEANDIRRPNKERLAANVQQAMQFVAPVLKEYGQQTTNTQPWNAFIQMFGEATEMDVAQMMLGPWAPAPPPPPPPEIQQHQQMMAQLEAQKAQAEIQKMQAESQYRQSEAQARQIEVQIEQARLQIEAQQNQAEAQSKAMEQQQQMQMRQVEQQLAMYAKQQEAAAKERERQQKIRFDQAQHIQDIRQDQVQFAQDARQNERAWQQKMIQDRVAAEQKQRQMEAEAQVRLKSQQDMARERQKQAARQTSTNGSSKA